MELCAHQMDLEIPAILLMAGRGKSGISQTDAITWSCMRLVANHIAITCYKFDQCGKDFGKLISKHRAYANPSHMESMTKCLESMEDASDISKDLRWFKIPTSLLLDQFPFMNQATINRSIRRLEEGGILESAMLEGKGKVKWFAFQVDSSTGALYEDGYMHIKDPEEGWLSNED